MARVRSIPSAELPADLAKTYEDFASGYGPFRNQAAVFAHVPPALKHLMGMLMELRAANTLPKRYLEIAIVVVSKLNECDYCVAHHKPFLAVEGLASAAIDGLLDWQTTPGLTEVDRLVAEFAEKVWTDPHRLRDELFERMRVHFSEAQIVELTLRTTLCGFFNKFNDALQIEEEVEATARVAALSA